MSKELRRRLQQADPNLTIVPPWKRRSTGHRATQRDWDAAAGVICRKCGKEVFRSRDGLCMACWEKENEIEVRDTCNALGFFSMEVIEQITHKARKDEPT